MRKGLLETYFQNLKEQFHFEFGILHDEDNSILRIVLGNVVLQNQFLDLDHLPWPENPLRELFIHIDALILTDSEINLPSDLHQLSINQATINNSKFYVGMRDVNVEEKKVGLLNSVIIGLEHCQISSLSIFDQIPNDLILQITDCELNRLHSSNNLPDSLVMLTLRDSIIYELGVMRTNEKIQLFSLEIDETKDHEFILEVYSDILLKARISGPQDIIITGSLKFFKPQKKLYFLDLQFFNIQICYNPDENLLDFFNDLKYLRLPKNQLEISDKMIALLKISGVNLNKFHLR